MTIEPKTGRAQTLATNLDLAAKVAKAWAQGNFAPTDPDALWRYGFDVEAECLAWLDQENGLAAVHNPAANRLEYIDSDSNAVAIDLRNGTLTLC